MQFLCRFCEGYMKRMPRCFVLVKGISSYLCNHLYRRTRDAIKLLCAQFGFWVTVLNGRLPNSSL